MEPQNHKVAVGMSGGTDSSMAAYLLKEQGLEVVGLTLVLWDQPSSKFSTGHVQRARTVCDKLGIQHHVIDARPVFEERIVCPFVEAYLAGSTPSPCVLCNRMIKFGAMLEVARQRGCQRLATGHYARLEEQPDGTLALLRGRDPSRDQSYFLAGLSQQQLRCAVFPLGNMVKKDVRHMADRLGLVPHSLGESQDLCFIPDGDYAAFVERQAGQSLSQEGPIVTTDGDIIGTHSGIHRYTVGQRKGLGLGGGPWYVIRIEAAANRVVVGRREDALGCDVLVSDMNWVRTAPEPGTQLDVLAQLRYNMTAAPARLTVTATDNVTLHFSAPVHAVTPGQFAVCYHDDEALGGGWIVGQPTGEREIGHYSADEP